MRRNGNIYKYMAIYVDDLCIVTKDSKSIIDTLKNNYDFKLKNTGEISYHLGCVFFRDNNDTLCISPKTVIQKMNPLHHP